jgi:phosphatidylglycerol:prolipoprotein diacylglycerol transferase
MIPELFRIGPLSVSPFGVLVALAFLAAYYQLRWGLQYLDIGDDEDASTLVFAGAIGGLLGAKIYYAILYGDLGLILDRSGFVWYGGFLLATVLLLWQIRRRKMPPGRTLDALSLSLALGYAIGRVGCFLVGDDYGVPTDGPLGVIFPYGLPPTTVRNLRDTFGAEVPPGVPDGTLLAVHPTQLYETSLALLIWGFGLWLIRRPALEGSSGVVARWVIGLLACERFAVEFLRAKDDRLLGLFTVAQLISVLVVLTMVVLAWRARRTTADPGAVGGVGVEG